MPQCRIMGISKGIKREITGRKNEITNERINIAGSTRLRYKPSHILA
jgi:hypothetical protein